MADLTPSFAGFFRGIRLTPLARCEGQSPSQRGFHWYSCGKKLESSRCSTRLNSVTSLFRLETTSSDRVPAPPCRSFFMPYPVD